MLVKAHYLSLDPYMRGRMSDAKSYSAPVALGAVMEGQTAGEVVASTVEGFAPGDTVLGGFGWQRYSCVPPGRLFKIDAKEAPLSASLGVLGMPGLTAWVGLADIGTPKAGETMVVSAASGAVGQVVGQLGKIRGCKVIGIAGGPRNASSSPRRSASTPASTIPATSMPSSTRPAPRASTSTGRMSAARCRRRSSRASATTAGW